jgi:hypothetical protein
MTEHALSESQIFRAAVKLDPEKRPEYLNALAAGIAICRPKWNPCCELMTLTVTS